MAALASPDQFEAFSCDEISKMYSNTQNCIKLHNTFDENSLKMTRTLDEYASDMSFETSIFENRNKILQLIDSKLKIKRDGRATSNITESVLLDKYVEHQSAEIEYNKYEHIIAISDIHADLISFFLILIKQKIIKLQNASGELDLEKLANTIISAPSLRRNDILYDVLINYNIIFGYTDTLFVILGDIIDGRRDILSTSIYVKNVENNFGINELMIHIILYNMRVSALKMNSNVVIIMGNHDLLLRSMPEYDKYVDLFTKNADLNGFAKKSFADIFISC
jgi:hypothetical protein